LPIAVRNNAATMAMKSDHAWKTERDDAETLLVWAVLTVGVDRHNPDHPGSEGMHQSCEI
jgi:hypothetical protein